MLIIFANTGSYWSCRRRSTASFHLFSPILHAQPPAVTTPCRSDDSTPQSESHACAENTGYTALLHQPSVTVTGSGDSILSNHFISWAWNFMVWRHRTCLWTLDFVDFKLYAILLKWSSISLGSSIRGLPYPGNTLNLMSNENKGFHSTRIVTYRDDFMSILLQCVIVFNDSQGYKCFVKFDIKMESFSRLRMLWLIYLNIDCQVNRKSTDTRIK